MKVGIKKHQENEWIVQLGCASVKMDRFAVELLNITLEHLVALGSGQQHSTLKSYIHMAQKLKLLSPSGMQKLVHSVENADLLALMLIVNDEALNEQILSNVGGILAKQLTVDLQKSAQPDDDAGKMAIKKVMERLFDLESKGQIEFVNQDVQYI